MARSRHIRAVPILLLACCLGVLSYGEAQASVTPALPNFAQGSGSPVTLWPRMTDSEKRGTADGAAIGAIAGAFISAYPAMTEGAGGGAGGNSLAWVGAGTLLGGLIGGSLGYLAARKWPASFENIPKCAGYTLVNSCAQFDPWESFSFSLYFERRLTPFYYRYETDWPATFLPEIGISCNF